ncbi:hypothetical protein AAMO2058_000571300 [Amorphochlora amoebiformis]
MPFSLTFTDFIRTPGIQLFGFQKSGLRDMAPKRPKPLYLGRLFACMVVLGCAMVIIPESSMAPSKGRLKWNCIGKRKMRHVMDQIDEGPEQDLDPEIDWAAIERMSRWDNEEVLAKAREYKIRYSAIRLLELADLHGSDLMTLTPEEFKEAFPIVGARKAVKKWIYDLAKGMPPPIDPLAPGPTQAPTAASMPTTDAMEFKPAPDQTLEPPDPGLPADIVEQGLPAAAQETPIEATDDPPEFEDPGTPTMEEVDLCGGQEAQGNAKKLEATKNGIITVQDAPEEPMMSAPDEELSGPSGTTTLTLRVSEDDSAPGMVGERGDTPPAESPGPSIEAVEQDDRHLEPSSEAATSVERASEKVETGFAPREIGTQCGQSGGGAPATSDVGVSEEERSRKSEEKEESKEEKSGGKIKGFQHLDLDEDTTASRVAKAVARKTEKVVGIPVIMTGDSKRALMRLGYTAVEARYLHPSRAEIILELGLRRPPRGLPDKWRRDYRGPDVPLPPMEATPSERRPAVMKALYLPLATGAVLARGALRSARILANLTLIQPAKATRSELNKFKVSALTFFRNLNRYQISALVALGALEMYSAGRRASKKRLPPPAPPPLKTRVFSILLG